MKLFFLLLAFLLSYNSINAQETLTWQEQFDLYSQAHLEYTSSRQAYQNYQTLTTREQAIKDTKKVLWERNETLKKYLDQLIADLSAFGKIHNPNPEELASQLAVWQSWLSGQQSQIDQLNNITDINDYSKLWEKKYPELELLIYRALTTHATSQQSQSLTKTEALVQEISAYPDQSLLTQKWLGETTIKTDLIRQKLEKAHLIINPLNTYQSQYDRLWTKTKEELLAAANYHLEILSHLEEIITYLPQ